MKVKITKLKEIIKDTVINEEQKLKESFVVKQPNPHKDLLLKLLQDDDKEFVVKLVSKIKKIRGDSL